MPGNPHPDRGPVRLAWEETFGSPPPPYLSVAFMEKALAYEMQCKAHGGLSATTRRALAQVATGKSVRDAAPVAVRPGAHLVREWNGRTYQVAAIEGGFEMDGRMWASLSAIAKHITGTSWSGPRFFGLTGRARVGP